ncbi:hypothetical protein ACFY2J_21710 [Streptomyces collinus]|uniref:hypothetical protein n=1 Tax=Streptomyces collinus TaxID=42684 RepID=UPI00367C6871
MSAVRTVLVSLAFAACASCAVPAPQEMPGAVCGTQIDPGLTRLLVKSTDDLHEYNRVDRTETITGPCVLLAGHDPVLEFRFSWDHSATDLMYLATGSGSTSQITNPRISEATAKTLIGTDGAISQAPCRTKGGNYFTLTLQLPKIKPGDRAHRGDIERFMRAYFPATLRTLGCG